MSFDRMVSVFVTAFLLKTALCSRSDCSSSCSATASWIYPSDRTLQFELRSLRPTSWLLSSSLSGPSAELRSGFAEARSIGSEHEPPPLARLPNRCRSRSMLLGARGGWFFSAFALCHCSSMDCWSSSWPNYRVLAWRSSLLFRTAPPCFLAAKIAKPPSPFSPELRKGEGPGWPSLKLTTSLLFSFLLSLASIACN